MPIPASPRVLLNGRRFYEGLESWVDTCSSDGQMGLDCCDILNSKAFHANVLAFSMNVK